MKQYFYKIVAFNQEAQMQHPFHDKSPTKFENAKQTNFMNSDQYSKWHIKQTSNSGNNWM